jgi:hypothetical protein
VARSNTKAEYHAIANATVELKWLQSLLKELGVFLPPTPTLWCENIGITHLVANLAFHAQIKHIEIDYHCVRHCMANCVLQVRLISSYDQLRYSQLGFGVMQQPPFILINGTLFQRKNTM